MPRPLHPLLPLSPRASSAGGNRPSHSEHSPAGTRRERREKLQQIHQAFPSPGSKSFHQTQRHLLLDHRGPESTPFSSPENTPHKCPHPPLSPVPHSPAIDPQSVTKPLHSSLSQPMHHGRNQNHDDSHIDFPTQKTHRHRGLALTASLPGTTKTVPLLPSGSSPGLPSVIPPMQGSSAMFTSPCLCLQRQIPIDFLQQLVYSLVLEYLLHVGPSPIVSENKKPHGAPSSSVR